MKSTLILLISVITLFSCSSDSDNSPAGEGNIVNKWHLTSIVENGTPLSGYTCNTNFDVTQFFDDGSSITKYGDTNSSGACVQYTEIGKYTLTNNIVEDVQRNSSNVIIYKARYKVLELTQTSLKLSLLYLYETSSTGTNPHTTNYSEGQEVRIYEKTN
ncbi:hypothetical protein LZZ90_00690 [Flavobacterium sp. SM15]|uniref:lipocalin family protein n=1 Tax=Flavobacterium sp. SM15 TaxID=2908005 RepID=UPI001EDB7DEB|nr:lipocalin family protein [Flavobacterium sp. SM15]MCG2610019.1 hypothetical protein [Flavobacterium sp. SM15]